MVIVLRKKKKKGHLSFLTGINSSECCTRQERFWARRLYLSLTSALLYMTAPRSTAAFRHWNNQG